MNTRVNNRKTVLLRKKNPLFKQIGTVSPEYCLEFVKHIHNWSLADTLRLRDKNNIGYDMSRLKSYNHSNIQYTTHPEPQTTDYNSVYEEYKRSRYFLG